MVNGLSECLTFFKDILDGLASMIQTHQIVFFMFALPIFAAVFIVGGCFIFDVRDEFTTYFYKHRPQRYYDMSYYYNGRPLSYDRRYRHLYGGFGYNQYERIARQMLKQQKPKLHKTTDYQKYKQYQNRPVHHYSQSNTSKYYSGNGRAARLARAGRLDVQVD